MPDLFRNDLGQFTSAQTNFSVQMYESGYFSVATPAVSSRIQSKFGRPGITWDTSEFNTNIKHVLDAIRYNPRIYGNIIHIVMEEIVEYAKKIAPFDKLDGKRSAKAQEKYEMKHPYGHLNEAIFYQISADGKAAIVTVNTREFPYAAIQHETPPPTYLHLAGKSWKYIEIPLHLIGRRMPRDVADNFIENLKLNLAGKVTLRQQPYFTQARFKSIDAELQSILKGQ